MSDPLNTATNPNTRSAASYTLRPPRQSPSTAKGKDTSVQEDFEADIDKFATLFSPATPRASPTYANIGLPGGSGSASRHTSWRPHPPPRILEEDSEFGAFVSVPVAEDPLSADIPSFEIDHLPPPMQAISPAMLQPSSTSKPSSRSSSSSRPALESDNTSLNFFDRFAQDAKKASEQRGRDLVHELLMHEDDPMYFLKDEEGKAKMPGTPPNTAFAGSFGGNMSSPSLINAPSTSATVPDQEQSLIDPLAHLDLDSEYFSPRSQIPSRPISHGHRRSSSHPRREGSMSMASPVGSPILTAPALAPPLANTTLVNSMKPPSHDEEQLWRSDLGGGNGAAREVERLSPPLRSNSYQTLSSLSSKWMPSFLSSSRPGDRAGDKKPSLDTIFASASGSSSDGGGTPPRRSRTPNSTYIQPHHDHAVPQLAQSSDNIQPHFNSLPQSTISSSPFGASTVTHSSSPFASHTFVPPSGAPGFKGEGYDWDKGFSSELERELLDGVHGSIGKRAGEDERLKREGNGFGGGREMRAGLGPERERRGNEMGEQSQGRHEREGSAGMGLLIEKKSGSVELKGRREGTMEILSRELAELIRPNLPALFRLPRSWSLLYSLDQHGISLNTLYARCETHFSKPGNTGSSGSSLVVVKDAGDTVFGVWMGEGLKMSRGKGYFGSGESFLWSYKEDRLKVYKWTGKNDYVALCEPGYISFGGGDGRYGLYLDDTLYDGSSAPCPTFGNEPLCSPGPLKAGAVEFECVGLEVWAVGP